jgi:hypothetical protein
MKIQWRLLCVMSVLQALSCTCASAQTASAVPESAQTACRSLAAADFSRIEDAPTQLTESKFVDANGVVPAYCLAKGYVFTRVGIELRLPVQGWNGKFLEVGCGGMCGVYFSKLCSGPLRKGYACIATDMGHTGLTEQAGWAYNDLQAQVDWGYRAAHVTAVAGKAITSEFYRRDPAKSYFLGCSTGGREGLVEAQRFPWDFDGIVAGAPPVNWAAFPLDVMWGIRSLTGSDGKYLFSKAEMQMLHEAVVAKCDMDDGVKDGVIGNPPACKFDPAVLQCRQGASSSCFSPRQVEAVRKIYAGPPLPHIERSYMMGAAKGSELNWLNSALSYVSGTRIFSDLFRYAYFWPSPGPGYDMKTFDFDKDFKRLGMAASLASANNPDLRKFAANGGKLLVYFGWQDASPPEATDYYQTVERTMGGRTATQNFFRLFMVPGMDHCTGGAGAFAIDYLSALEAWVEQGKAPDKLVGAHIDDMSWGEAFNFPFPLDPKTTPVAFTRPVFPYPAYAKYKGSGDPNDGANFVAVNPR